MNIRHYAHASFIGLKTNLVRSILTILGIVIGIASIILIVSLGNGAQNLILDQVKGLGTRTIIISAGGDAAGPPNRTQSTKVSLKQRDVDALEQKSNAPHISKVMPLVNGAGTAEVGSNSYRISLFGATDAMSEIYSLVPVEGSFFAEEEVRSSSDVVVIGSEVKNQLYPNEDALGKRIKIEGHNFVIVGVLPSKGSSALINFDKAAIIPYTTAQNYIFGTKYFNNIVVESDSEKTIALSVDDIKNTLRTLHKIEDPTKDDFQVQNQADLSNRLSIITDVLTYFLAAVAAISLLVGGIGIMNIMLVSVTERTREIGLRKAVGATNRNILIQFLLEAVYLTLAGGIVGVLIGTTLSLIASFLIIKVFGFDWTFIFPYSAAIIGVAVSAVVGLVFGLYPARQASKKSPIEALRYE